MNIRKLLWMMIFLLAASSAFAQGLNKVVVGPLEGNSAGVMTVRNGQHVWLPVWVRTDPDNPAPVTIIHHGLLSENDVIAVRRGCYWTYYYAMPKWDTTFVDGPYVHNPEDAYPVPEGNTCEIQGAFYDIFGTPQGDPLDTDGEWDEYGYFLMTCDTDIPTDNTYYPFSMGWFPQDGGGTTWGFDDPPGGEVIPEQDYCGLYFEEPSSTLNKIVFGPLDGDSAGVLTVRNGEEIEIEMWVRTDPDNPAPIEGVAHGLMSENSIIAERNGIDPEPEYDVPFWEQFFVDGPYFHDPQDYFPIPEAYTCEMQGALWRWYPPFGDPLDTEGEWDLYGTWLMVTNTGIPIGQTYYPFADGWYPHSGQGTFWAFDVGGIIPETEFCGLYFESDTCIYVPGDVNDNGELLELADVVAMIGNYRGIVEPYYTCTCTEDSPYLGFAATADPNGNCVPSELSDVVAEIGAYRGTSGVSGCPDCPGSEGLLLGDSKDR